MSIIDKGRYKFEKTPSSESGTIEELSIYSSSSPNCRNSAKEDKIKIVETSLSNIEKSLINKCESTELEIMSEKLLDTSIEEQKSNKENQMLNIISDVSVEKSMQPKVTSSFSKPPASSFTNNSLSEKETKSMKKELNSSKRRRSRESIEIAIKHSDLPKETADRFQENMDISIESLSSTTTNKTILLQDSIELVDKVTNKDEIFESTTYNEDATVISELSKIDKKQDTFADNKNSNKIKSNEVDKTSHLPMSLVKSTRISDSRESLTSILTIDDNNEIKLVLEEQSPRRDENEISSHIHSNTDQLKNLQILSSVNEGFDDSATIMDKQSTLTQAKVIDSSTEEGQEEENLSKQVTELAFESSNTVLETNNSTHDDSIDAVKDNQSPDVIEASKKSTVDVSPEKTDAKDSLSEKIVKQNLKRKSTDVLDNLEGEKESLQMETSQKDQENMEIADDISDVNADLELFQDIPADKWKDKNDVKTGSVQSTSQSVEKMENENEAECDLILVDKQAWLAAETIKAAKEAELFEYDSDDTVLLKSRLDASQANDTEKLVTIDEELMDINNEENEKQIKKQKSKTKRKRVSEIDQDSSGCTENEDNLIEKALDELRSKIFLNQTNDRSISRLNKSEQSLKTRRQFFKASNESDEDIEDNANELNRSSLLSKKNISLQKSKGRTSLNKSLKDTSMQNISVNKSSIDNLEKELDDTDAHTGKKLYKNERSLNKSCNEDADDNTTDFEKKNVLIDDGNKKDENISLKYSIGQESKPDIKITVYDNDDESDNSEISIAAMDFGSKTYSTIANVGSVDSDKDERDILSYLFAKANSDIDTDDSSSDSDINKEYNLDGIEPKFSDEDVAADECRTSEVEFSDSDDNGSDLADFIVDDNEVEDDKEDEDDDDEDEDNEKNSEEKDDYEDNEEDENMQNIENDEVAKEDVEDEEEKESHINAELINMENENEDEDIQEKDAADKEDANTQFAEIEAISSYTSTSHKLPKIHKSKNKSIEYNLFCRSETETKGDNKMKSNEDMKKKEKPILLNSSNSDLSIKETKKKSLMKENETILSDTSNLSSSSLKKKKKLDPQYPSRNEPERNSSEQLSELESMSAKKLSKPRVLMEFSTPNLDSCKKLELDETFETFDRIPENEDIKTSTMITTMQNTSIKKSKKDLTLNKDISSKKFSDANKEKMSKNDFSPDLLELLDKTNFLKSTSSKIKLCKTMNILDTETPTLKYLRKEKLNESAPTLKSSIEIGLLQKKLSMEKDSAQMKIEEKNNDEVYDLISLSTDDIIQNYKRLESLNKSIIDKVSSEEIIKLNVHKKKKSLKHTQLTIKENNIRKAACQINEKKKKKKKQDILKENITDKISSEDAIELNVPNKKKLIKPTQSTIVEDNITGNTCQISKKKKKQDTLNENITDKVSSGDAIELNVFKKKKRAQLTQLPIVEDNICEYVCQINEKKKKKKKQDTLKENITDKILSEDVIELKIPKKKKRSQLTQLPTVEDNICEDVCQVNEKKKKKKKQDTLKENITDKVLSEDTVELNVPKKRKPVKLTQSSIVEDNICEDVCQISERKKKKKKQYTLKENITDKVLSEDVIELKIPKKKKLSQLTQLPIVEDNICEDVCEINERKKKKKKQDTLKKNITDKVLSEDAVELNVPKKRKPIKLTQSTIVEDNICEDVCQISERKKKKINKIVEENTNVNEDNILRKNIRGNKTELGQHKKNKILNSLKLDSRADKQEKQIKRKIKQQEVAENIETLPIEKKKKNTLPVQIPVSKLKSKKILLPNKLRLQKTALDMSESKNIACSTKELDEAAHVAKVFIPKELKPKKKRDRTEDIENTIHVNVPKKLKKEVKEVNKFLPSSSGLKRLSDDVIDNLADVPTRKKKRQKISQKEKTISSVTTDKSKATTADCDNLFTLSTSGSTTQFRIVNLQDTKKQSSKGVAAAVSFRQRMLARNNREPISAYMIYREKMSHAK